MQVVAIKDGHYGSYRAVGDVFEVAEGDKASWFEPVDGGENPAPAKKATGASGAGVSGKVKNAGDVNPV